MAMGRTNFEGVVFDDYIIIVAIAMKFWEFHFECLRKTIFKFQKYKIFILKVIRKFAMRDFDGSVEVEF